MTTHLSKVFALHAELIAVWFSTDTHLHTNAVVTNLSICPFSRGRKQCEYYRKAEGYCCGSCQRFDTKPLQLLQTTATRSFHCLLVQQLHKGHKGWHKGASTLKHLTEYGLYQEPRTHRQWDRQLVVQNVFRWPKRPPFTSLSLNGNYAFTPGEKQMITIKRGWSFHLNNLDLFPCCGAMPQRLYANAAISVYVEAA